jgi:hypothetical protein
MIKVEITAVSRVDLLKQVEDLFNAIMPANAGAAVPASAGGNGKAKPAETETVQEAGETSAAAPRGRGRPPKAAAVAARKEPETVPEAESLFDPPPEPEAEKVPVKIGKPDLLKVLTKYVDAFGEPATVSLLAEHGSGATKVSMLDAKDYAAVHAAALAALPNS